jgi:ATP-dependent Lon protease
LFLSSRLVNKLEANRNVVPKAILQMVMEIDNPLERAHLVLKFTKRFKEDYLRIWTDISSKTEKATSPKEAKEQIDHLYKFLKKIQDENASPTKRNLIKKVRNSLETKKYPKELEQLIQEEFEKIQEMSENYHDFQLTKDFLDLVCDLPYGVESKDNYDLTKAKEILDKDHFGMEKVKKKILEFIAVSKIRGSVKGKNLLLVGPPGVGKTSVASSIARCLDREFVRISLGGESDVAVIKGHRKTYIGAYPGKLVKALKQAKTENPVILLDEIDKISTGFKGSIQDTLLEVLDPKQNHAFRDHYLEAPLDLSKVLFICSANLLESISEPLLDRLETLELSGYTREEKKKIATNYLIPKAMKEKGITTEEGTRYKVEIPEETLEFLVDRYAREAGVRGLEKKVNRIFEQICRRIVEHDETEFLVQPEHIRKYIGPPIFSSDRLYPSTSLPKGVSIGLSYNSMGGGILFIETAQAAFPLLPLKPASEIKQDQASSGIEVVENKAVAPVVSTTPGPAGLIVTGSLGKVMQESMQIAHTYTKFLCQNLLGNKYLEEHTIHVHFPEGASKKDGPSAGISITTALVSLATGVSVPGDTGMTGEISLNGKVLKIGGLREKALAAKREGLRRVIVPESNKADVAEMPAEIKEGIEFCFVKEYPEILKLMFPSLSPVS